MNEPENNNQDDNSSESMSSMIRKIGKPSDCHEVQLFKDEIKVEKFAAKSS